MRMRGGCGDPPRLAILVAAFSVAAALAAAFGAGCEPTAKDARPTLLFSSDDQGVLAACGCPSNPSGGLAKRQALIEQYRRSRANVCVVDAGDVMSEPGRPNEIKMKYLVEVLARAKYDAIGLGDQEFAQGAETLRKLAREHSLPFICANVRDEAGQPVVPPHVIREVGGLRVGIFAVIADRAYGFPPLEWRTGLKVEPPIEAARREVKELAGCDVVIALSHQTIAETRDLASSVPGIQVLVSGHDATLLPKPEAVKGALLVATGDEGRILGALAIRRGAGGRPEFTCEMTELSAQVPDAKWVMDLYWQYVKDAKEKPPPDWNLTPVPAAYEPAEACGKCHAEEYRQWLTTSHAHSYASIKRSRRQDDPECVLCHTIGLGRKGGFVSMRETPDLGRVTCQTCHIVTSGHGAKGAAKDEMLDPRIYINSRLCMSCHGPIQSPNFDYYVYKPKIVHRPPETGKQ
jgi:hypothetical protein